MVTFTAICSNCLYYRTRPKPQLFTGSELQTPGVLKSMNEWEQQEQNRWQNEQQILEAGRPFFFEPHHYAWCDMYTPFDATLPEAMDRALNRSDIEGARELAKKSNQRLKELILLAQNGDTSPLDELAGHGSATMNPVTGEIMQIYGLCARMNPDGQCPMYEPKVSPQKSGW